MINVSEQFKAAIKSSARSICSKIVLHYETDITLEDDKVISISAQSSAEIALGGVQDDVLTIELIKGAITDLQFNADIDITVYVGVYINDVAEYAEIGKYTTNAWKKNDKTGIVTIELVSKINNKSTIPKNIIAESGTTIDEYAEKVVLDAYNEVLEVDSNITSQALSKSWLMYETTTEQLKSFGMACNGLFRYTSKFELVPFKPMATTTILKVGTNEELLEVTRLSDYSKTKQQVSILKSKFNESTLTKLTSSNLQTKGGTNTTVELKTGGPVKVAYVMIGNEYGRLDGIVQGITWCNVIIADVYGESNHVIPVEIYGHRVESLCKDSKPVTDGSVTYIENPYIQSAEHIAALDKSIYEGIRYRLKFRGNPCYQVGDTIVVENIGNVLIYKRQLNYSGGLSGYLEGVLVEQITAEYVEYLDGTWYANGTKMLRP